jgi:hypothetical protein
MAFPRPSAHAAIRAAGSSASHSAARQVADPER